MGTWATPAEASAITGTTLYQSDLDQAQSIIDLFTDMHYGLVAELQPRTLRILTRPSAAITETRTGQSAGRSSFDAAS